MPQRKLRETSLSMAKGADTGHGGIRLGIGDEQEYPSSDQRSEHRQTRICFLLGAVTLGFVEVGAALTAQPSTLGTTEWMKWKGQEDVLAKWRGKIYPSSA
jgi:hypothetical protein